MGTKRPRQGMGSLAKEAQRRDPDGIQGAEAKLRPCWFTGYRLARGMGSTADCLGRCSLIVPQFPHLGNENPRRELGDYFIAEQAGRGYKYIHKSPFKGMLLKLHLSQNYDNLECRQKVLRKHPSYSKIQIQ